MRKRPVSPHLTIYSTLITSASSIIGRIAGVYVYILAVFIGYLMAFNIQNRKDAGSILGFLMSTAQSNTALYVFLIIFTFISVIAFFFYILAILRHLIWDFTYCLELKKAKILGYGMFILSFVIGVIITTYMFWI